MITTMMMVGNMTFARLIYDLQRTWYFCLMTRAGLFFADCETTRKNSEATDGRLLADRLATMTGVGS